MAAQAETARRLAAASKQKPFVNSLGMEFVPVPGTKVLFCRWIVRVKDYRMFADETKRVWWKPTFAQTDEHPAVNVSWEDAKAFCAWLSRKEGWTYRLPTDAEWSRAVGLPAETGRTPEEKDAKIVAVYPWGTQWPPPKGSGNYDPSVRGDDYKFTSPVGSFTANKNGLYDMGGNVWECCEDWYNEKQDRRVVRGGSWNSDAEVYLRSSCRNRGVPPTLRGVDGGFRCVLMTPGG